jgi:hypothetical protein
VDVCTDRLPPECVYVTRTSVGVRAVAISRKLHPRDPVVSGWGTAVTRVIGRVISLADSVLCVGELCPRR